MNFDNLISKHFLRWAALGWLLRFHIMAAILVLLLFIRYFCSVLLWIYICETRILIYCLIFFENLPKELVLRNYNRRCCAGLFYICGISTFLQPTFQCCVLLEKVVFRLIPSHLVFITRFSRPLVRKQLAFVSVWIMTQPSWWWSKNAKVVLATSSPHSPQWSVSQVGPGTAD